MFVIMDFALGSGIYVCGKRMFRRYDARTVRRGLCDEEVFLGQFTIELLICYETSRSTNDTIAKRGEKDNFCQ